jgi:hypothetical protein
VRGNGILFAYYPNREWLDAYKYLGDCGDHERTTDQELRARDS